MSQVVWSVLLQRSFNPRRFPALKKGSFGESSALQSAFHTQQQPFSNPVFANRQAEIKAIGKKF